MTIFFDDVFVDAGTEGEVVGLTVGVDVKFFHGGRGQVFDLALVLGKTMLIKVALF